MSTCTYNKAKVEEDGLSNGDSARAIQEVNIDGGEPAVPPSKPNNPTGNDSTSQRSSLRRRRHKRGGRKKKTVTEPNDGMQPLQAIDHTSPSTADRETHTIGTNGVEDESPYSKSITADSDYSDIASVDFQSPSASHRRRHQRGGRRNAKSPHHLQSVSEFTVARDQTEQYDAAPPDPEWRDWHNDDDDDSRRARPSKVKKRNETGDMKSTTGIRAFNLRRADESRGSGTGSASDNKEKKPKERPTKEKAKGRGKRRDKDTDESEKEEKDKRKPVSIRLDLDLELEIFLKAKIKGDITITFL